MFALALAAACAITIADVRDVEGQELPQLPQLPEVQVPSLPKVPELQRPPQLQLPDPPPAPSVPRVQAPKPSLSGPGSTPGVPAGGALPRSTGDARTPAGGSTPEAAGSRAGTASRADDEDGKTRRAATRQERAATRRERRLRRIVKELWACSYAVSGFERQVLIRRVGLDGYNPGSSAVVARQLQVSVKRIRRAQRSGVRHLRTANRSDGCALSSPPAAVEQTVGVLRAVATAPALVTPENATLANAERSPASESDGKGEVLGERRTSTPVHIDRPQIAGTLSTAGSDGGSEPWLLILILSLMAVAAATPLLLYRRRQTGPSPAQHAPPPRVIPTPARVEEQPQTQPEPEPEPEPEVEPEPALTPQPTYELPSPPWTEPEPEPDPGPPPAPPQPEPRTEVQHGARRRAGVTFSAIASLAATLMMRSRRRR